MSTWYRPCSVVVADHRRGQSEQNIEQSLRSFPVNPRFLQSDVATLTTGEGELGSSKPLAGACHASLPKTLDDGM